MTNKEKMIETFGGEPVKDLIMVLKPSSMAYVRFLEWLLEDYKEPCENPIEHAENDTFESDNKYPWGDKKDTMTIHSEEYDTDVEVPVISGKRRNRLRKG